MQQLESVGWVKVQKKESNQLTELDVDEIFKMIDVDKSGSISRSVSTDQCTVGNFGDQTIWLQSIFFIQNPLKYLYLAS